MKQTKLKEAMSRFKDKGFKYTKKREQILSYLFQNNRYISAKNVYDFMEENYPGISYNTIYRNLHDFVLAGLAEETELQGEKKFRFACNFDANGHHHHFICTSCGKTKEIELCPMNFFKEQLPGCKIEEHRFEIYGKCELCNK